MERVFPKSVVEVAAKLAENQDFDNEVTKAFADVVAGYLTGDGVSSSYADGKYTINVNGDGYYLIKNTKVPENATGTSFTRYILKVVGNVEVTHKGEVPKVEKKIVEGDEKVDANTADVGDTINYEITGTLPSNVADYDTYYYVFHDTLSKGLTYCCYHF